MLPSEGARALVGCAERVSPLSRQRSVKTRRDDATSVRVKGVDILSDAPLQPFPNARPSFNRPQSVAESGVDVRLVGRHREEYATDDCSPGPAAAVQSWLG